VLAGDVRAAARACRGIDDRLPGHTELLAQLDRHAPRAWLLGVTGNPGAGKSTLTDRLLSKLRARGQRVGVLAIDPSSPFSGGAVLGDRVRMQRHFEDPEVFIRSLATRGKLGGLSRSTLGLMRVMEAWGARAIIVETVGVGQAEIDVVRATHTTVIVTAPGLGDDIQAAKAGLLECGDVFVVNKADRPRAEVLVSQLEQMIALGVAVRQGARPAPVGHGHGAARALDHERAAQPGAGEPGTDESAAASMSWTPPVLRCVATRDEGVDELLSALERHRTWLDTTLAGSALSQARRKEQVTRYLEDSLVDDVLAHERASIDAAVQAVLDGSSSPFEAGDRLIERVLKPIAEDDPIS